MHSAERIDTEEARRILAEQLDSGEITEEEYDEALSVIEEQESLKDGRAYSVSEDVRSAEEETMVEENPQKQTDALEPEQGRKNTASEGGVQYSFADQRIPTYEELVAKPDIKVVDIRGNSSGTYKEQRKEFLNSSLAQEMYRNPVVNRDTGELVHIVPATFTHSFSNYAANQIAAVKKLPEIIENAVLTHAEPSRSEADDHTTGVYTLFGAVRSDFGIQPVKLKVKEYRLDGQDIPETVKALISSEDTEFASAYDNRVLVLEGIEKESTSSSAASSNALAQPDNHPSVLPKISVAELYNLVNEEYKKYLPERKTAQQHSISDNKPMEAMLPGGEVETETAEEVAENAGIDTVLEAKLPGGETEDAEETLEDVVGKRPTKAKNYLRKTQRGLLNNVSKMLGVPYYARREYLQEIVEDISREYLKNGRAYSVSENVKSEEERAKRRFEERKEKEMRNCVRRAGREKFYNRVKNRSGNDVLYSSIEKLLVRDGYLDNGVNIHRSGNSLLIFERFDAFMG